MKVVVVDGSGDQAGLAAPPHSCLTSDEILTRLFLLPEFTDRIFKESAD